MIILFVTITVAQYIGAFVSKSLALFGDSATMTIDVVTYIMNLYAEVSTSLPAVKQRNQLISSGLSIGILMGLSAFLIIDAILRLSEQRRGDEESVNADIVIVFAVLGLIIDVVSCSAF